MTMMNHVEINVSHFGKHFFATHPRSGTDLNKIKEVLCEIRKKFPPREGYEVTATYWQASGRKFIES